MTQTPVTAGEGTIERSESITWLDLVFDLEVVAAVLVLSDGLVLRCHGAVDDQKRDDS